MLKNVRSILFRNGNCLIRKRDHLVENVFTSKKLKIKNLFELLIWEFENHFDFFEVIKMILTYYVRKLLKYMYFKVMKS